MPTLEKIPEIYFTKLGLMATLLSGEVRYEAAQKQKAIAAEELVDMLIAAGKHLKDVGEVEKATAQFKIAQKVMDAFAEDFLEDRWFTAPLFDRECAQRKEIHRLLNE